jgi:hypothetical protein
MASYSESGGLLGYSNDAISTADVRWERIRQEAATLQQVLKLCDTTVRLPAVNGTTTYGSTGGFGRLRLLLSANAVKVGFGASTGGRTGTGGFARISLLQYSTSVSSSAETWLAKLEACN